MSTQPPRPDPSGESDASTVAPPGDPVAPTRHDPAVGADERAGEWFVEGSAGRSPIAPEEVDRASRAHWESEADAYQAEHGAFLAGMAVPVVLGSSADPVDLRAGGDESGDPAAAGSGAGSGRGSTAAFVWGPEGLTEADAGLLGPLDELVGRSALEVGCGAAQCSAWLAQRGVRAVGIDIAVNQLRHAVASCHPSGHLMTSAMTHGGGTAGEGALHVVSATATALPFADATFDAAFSAYGAVQFVADLPRLLGEVHRVLRPGGRWAFSVTHPIRWAFPDDPGSAGLSASGSYFDRMPYVERDGSGAAVYAEFHRTLGDYVCALRAAGFSIEQMVEPEWPDWNDATWGGWSPLRGKRLPGTLVIGCRADAAPSR